MTDEEAIDESLAIAGGFARQMKKWKRRYYVVLAIAALGWLLALMAIAELLSLYL